MSENSSHTILVVEDEVTMRKPLIEALAEEGFRTLSAQDGAEGLELALREKPEVILLDINLPGMDGMQLMKKLRHSGDFGKSVKIIFITSLTADDEMMQGIAEGEPSYFLEKSEWNIPGMIRKVRELLGSIETEKSQ